jgi:hypothetical protein
MPPFFVGLKAMMSSPSFAVIKWIKAAFGWAAAKRCRLALAELKHSVERSWDQRNYSPLCGVVTRV